MAGISTPRRAWAKDMRRGLGFGCNLLLAAALLGLGCTRAGQDPDPEARAVTGLETAPESHACPTQPIAEQRAPDVRPEHEDPEFWLRKYEPAAVDAELLDEAELAFLRERVAALPGGWRDPLHEEVGDPELIEAELRERLEWLRGRVEAGKYVEAEPGALERAAARAEAATARSPSELRFVAVEIPLWCVPTTEGLYTPGPTSSSASAPAIDRDFDRNRCASLHPGEYVRALRSTPDGAWTYVEAGHSVGWIHRADRALEPPLPQAAARERLAGPRVYLSADYEGLRHGSSFPLVGSPPADPTRAALTILVPGLEGPIERRLAAGAPLSLEPWPLTRRRLFEQAFAMLEQPYGWGGRAGQRDCSRYLYDLFALFDVRLARNSGVQAKLGTRSVDLSQLDEPAKRAAIREAAQAGVVLLYMPGHIMLYLGQDDGRDYGISALSEYLVPCPGGPDTIHKLDKVALTTLEVGRGTERRAFIERITRMAVFGPAPEPELSE